MKTTQYIFRITAVVAVFFLMINVSTAQQQLKITTQTQVLLLPIPPSISTEPLDVTVCEGTDTMLFVSATGDAPLTYQWFYNGSSIPFTDDTLLLPMLTASSSGAYRCVVTNGCSSDTSIAATLIVNSLPVIDTLGGGGMFCIGGVGIPVTLSGSESGINYQLLVDGTNAGVPLTGTGSSLSWINQTVLGQYTVHATNSATGCAVNMNGFVMVGSYPQVTASALSSTNTSCFNGCDGTISFTATGTGPFSYDIGTENNITGDFASLCSGSYSVTVTDNNSCTATSSVTITQPSEISISLSAQSGSTCNGLCDGTATVSFSGGTGALSPVWTSGENAPTAIALCGGSNFVTVTDFNNCSSSLEVVIAEPSVLILTETITQPTCLNNDGQIALVVSGGTLSYSYIWDQGLIGTNPINLAEGVYHVTLTDGNLCTATGTYTLTMQSSNPVLTGIVSSSLGQLGAGDAVVKFYTERPNPLGGIFYDLYTEMTILSSGYNITLVPGNYIIRAMNMNTTLYPDLLNTYYSGVESWELATVISLSCDDVTQKDILMNELLTYNPGTSSLSGYITYYNGTKNGISESGDKELGEPVIGAEVFVEQEPNDEPIAQGNTDTNGYYLITDLAVGVGYNMSVEIPGIPLLSTYADLAINQDGVVYHNLNFFVDTTDLIGGIFIDTALGVPQNSLPFGMISISPNPAQNFVDVVYAGKNNSAVTVTLLDASGRELISQTKESVATEQKLTLPLQGYAKGTYYIKFVSGNSVYIKKLMLE